MLAIYPERIFINAYLEDQTRERSVVVILLDAINQELRKRRHDLSMLTKPEDLLAKNVLLPTNLACIGAA
jgi:hypothetical protein